MPTHRFQVGCPCCGPVCPCDCTWAAPRDNLTLTIDYGNTSCGITRRSVTLKDQGGVCPSFSTVGAEYFADFGAAYEYWPPGRSIQFGNLPYHRFGLYCSGPYYFLYWTWGPDPAFSHVGLTFRKVASRCSPFLLTLVPSDLFSCLGNCQRSGQPGADGTYETRHYQELPLGQPYPNPGCFPRYVSRLADYSPDPYNLRAISIA